MKVATDPRLLTILWGSFAVVVTALLVIYGLDCQVLNVGAPVRWLGMVGAGVVSCVSGVALVIGVRRRVPVIHLLGAIVAANAAVTASAFAWFSFMNRGLDTSSARSCSAVVTWRGWVGGRKGPAHFALKVSRTPSVDVETLVDVDWQHHFMLDVGAPVVVTTHAGALGGEWCDVDCVRSPW